MKRHAMTATAVAAAAKKRQRGETERYRWRKREGASERERENESWREANTRFVTKPTDIQFQLAAENWICFSYIMYIVRCAHGRWLVSLTLSLSLSLFASAESSHTWHHHIITQQCMRELTIFWRVLAAFTARTVYALSVHTDACAGVVCADLKSDWQTRRVARTQANVENFNCLTARTERERERASKSDAKCEVRVYRVIYDYFFLVPIDFLSQNFHSSPQQQQKRWINENFSFFLLQCQQWPTNRMVPYQLLSFEQRFGFRTPTEYFLFGSGRFDDESEYHSMEFE